MSDLRPQYCRYTDGRCNCPDCDCGRYLVERMRRHVASYKSLTRHRQDCLGMCDRIEQLEGALRSALEELEQCYADEGCTEQERKDQTEFIRRALTGESR